MTLETTPAEAQLAELDQWIVWRFGSRDGKPTKIPCRPNGRNLDVTDQTGWMSLADARNAFFRNPKVLAGIGFAFSENGNVTGIDLDDAYDAETGEVAEWAKPAVEVANSYTEISPGRDGLHIFAFGKKPAAINAGAVHCRRKVLDKSGAEIGEVEMYDRARFFTYTGNHLPGTPDTIIENSLGIQWVYETYLLPAPAKTKSNTTHNEIFGESNAAVLPPIEVRAPSFAELDAASSTEIRIATDGEIVGRIEKSRQADKFRSLYRNGDTSAYGNDDSRADSALACILAYYTKDAGQIERIISQSALGDRDKWRDRQDYRDRTIDAALKKITASAAPKGQAKTNTKGAPSASGEEPIEFPDVVPLDDTDPPDMPAGLLPGWLGSFSAEVANSIEVPRGFADVHALAAVATAAQGKFSVSPNKGYFEPVNFYVAAALPSGSRKSGVQAEFLKPIVAWEKAKIAEYAADLKKITNRKLIVEAQLKAARVRAEKTKIGTTEFDEAVKAVDELEAAIPEIPVAPRLITGDCTPEHLGTMLSQHDERLSIWSDEGGIIENFAGRYSNGVPNLDLLLQSFSGSRVDVDRGSRGSVRLNHPVLTICVTPQPSHLYKWGAHPGFRDRGLLARFWYIVPTSNLGFRALLPCPIRDEVENDYRDFLKTLLDLPPRLVDDRPLPRVLKLSVEAYDLWKDFQREIEDMMRPKGRLDGMTDIGGKMPGQAVRVAGLLHIAAHVSDIELSTTIERKAMADAITMARVCLEHALHAFSKMGVDDALIIARRLWEEAIRIGDPAVTARDLWHPTRRKYPRINDVEKGFDILVERGWLIEQEEQRFGRGRPAKRKFLLNPKAIAPSGHFGHHVLTSPPGRQTG